MFTVALFLEPQYDFILHKMDSGSPSIRRLFSTSSYYTLWPLWTSFQIALAYLARNVFNSCITCIIYTSVSMIESLVA